MINNLSLGEMSCDDDDNYQIGYKIYKFICKLITKIKA